MVGKRIRKRLDGTTAYVEQSAPFPQDGKQGWWSGGFGYGLWIGVLVASGFSVVPVISMTWRNGFELAGGRSAKEELRLCSLLHMEMA
ncbi:PREDICTED: uncharacterized protein LOC105125994 [Populus euphratica]|uniref:Uncharacterized protein LOC105125994 n=1 Tax=Populus euphratica TaxID=75702 RepID=A0AAJ6U8B1_POPEU|nr:PREDICTED: uncharacterized protein LOC105125994 [Populus euphratica]